MKFNPATTRDFHLSVPPSMQNFGYKISGGEKIFISTEINSTLIIKSIETFHRQFLDLTRQNGHVAFFGNVKPFLEYLPDGEAHLIEIREDYPIPFTPTGDPHTVIKTFKTSADSDAYTPQLDMYLLTGLMAVENLFELTYLFTSDKFRQKTIKRITDPVLRAHWEYFDDLPPRDQNERCVSVLNRLLPLITDKDIRRIISQSKPFMQPHILLVDLPDTDRHNLLASFILSQVKGVAFIERPLIHIGESTPIIHIDYLGQLPEVLKDKMLATATIMTTRTGVHDAEILTPHFNLFPGNTKLTELTEGMAYVRKETTEHIYTEHHKWPRKSSLPNLIRNNTKSESHTPTEIIDERIQTFLDGT